MTDTPDPTLPTPSSPQATVKRRIVTPAFIRLSHGLMALSFTLAYVTGDSERWRLLHVGMGYTLLGLLCVRVLYGWMGPPSSRLSLLWRRLGGAGAVWQAVRQASSLRDLPWRTAQNLLLPLSILAILALILPLTLSGHATYEDWGSGWGGLWGGLWADDWATEALAEVHEALGELLLITVLGHLALLLTLSLLRRRNLALPMITGRSDAP